MAVLDGADALTSHSAMNNRPLATKATGTNVAGGTWAAHRAWAATSKIEHTDVAISIVGSAVKSIEVRNSASRVALPLTNCAVTAAAQNIAVRVERVVVVMSSQKGCVQPAMADTGTYRWSNAPNHWNRRNRTGGNRSVPGGTA